MKVHRRYLEKSVTDDALKSGKIALISGPRQVGKTTLAKNLLESTINYFNWDNPVFRRKWAKNPLDALGQIGPGPVILDEIHKHKYWKRSLKGLYDEASDRIKFIVTGSARLDIYRKGGESMLGRYIPYRLHPFTVSESTPCSDPDNLEPKEIKFSLRDILKLSGFPEPLLEGNHKKAKRWSRLRIERIMFEDVRDLRMVHTLSQIQLMADILPTKVGSPLSLNSLREDIEVGYGTIREWNQLLSDLYVTFQIPPYFKKISRSLKTEKKLYLFDPLPIENEGFLLENTVALHLIKACHFWTDTAAGSFELFYIRTKDKEEVDFFITRDKKPWMLIECKSNDIQITKPLIKFNTILKPKYAFQTTTKKSYDRIDSKSGIRVINTEKFLSMLP